MNKSTQTGIWVSLAVIVVVGITYFAATNSNGTNNTTNGTYTAFAQCLETSGAKFYGAYWCPHCKDQKELFGDAEDDLPYIECALPGSSNTMTQECKDTGIEGYPTWIFADSSRLSGTQSLETLAEKTGCALPGADANSNTPSTEGQSVNSTSESNTNTEVTPITN